MCTNQIQFLIPQKNTLNFFRKTGEVVLVHHTPVEPFPPKFIYKINYTMSNRDEMCYTAPTVIPVEEDQEEEPDYYDYLIYNITKNREAKSVTPKVVKSDYDKNCLVDCLVLWIPDVSNNPGENFYLKYRVRGELEYTVTEPEMSEDYIILKNFDACKKYEMVLVAVDGEFSTESGPVLTPPKLYPYIH